MAEEGNCMAAINQLLNRIEDRISGHNLLHRINSGCEGDIERLIEQYGGETVELGVKIVDAYKCLDELVIRLQHKSQEI